MITLLRYLHILHQWSKWGIPVVVQDGYKTTYQERVCAKCDYIERRIL